MVGSAHNLDALNEYAAACTAWHVLARGGELTNGATSGWNAERDPTRSDLTFHASRSGDRYAVLMLRPLKKKGQAAQPKVPQFIAEHDGGPSDAYAALRRLAKSWTQCRRGNAATPLCSTCAGAERRVRSGL